MKMTERRRARGLGDIGGRVMSASDRERSRRAGIVTALLACTALGFPMMANAQDGTVPLAAEETDVLQQSMVLDEIVVTAGGYEQQIRNAPASISVIDREELDRTTFPDISEVLRTVPGVNVGFGSDGTRGISIRGLGSGYTLILIDGKRVNAGATTLRHYNGDLNWVPIGAIERIEVVRGPMSTLYGSDALGGVVNIITKQSSDRWTGTLTGEVLLGDSGATGDTRRINGFVSGPIIPNLLNFTAFGDITRNDADDASLADDIQVGDGSDQYNITGRLTYTPSADHTFQLEAGHGREKYLPYIPPGESDNSETSISRTTASLQHVGEWGFGTSTVTGYFEEATNRSDVNDTEMTDTNFTLDGKIVMPVEYYLPQSVILGGQIWHEELDDPVNLGRMNSVTNTTGSPVTSVLTAALFAEDEIEITEQFRTTLGLRYDYHETFGSHFSPRVYVNYDLTEALTFKAGWAQAFNAPNLRQLNPNWVTTSRGRGCGAVGGPCEMVGNPDLKPETSDSYEAGFFYDDGAIQASFAYFYNDVQDKITSARIASLVTPDGVKYVQQINVDRARTQGLEGGITIPLHDRLDWINSFTYLIESKNLETGMPLSADPEISIHSELNWRVLDNWVITGMLDYYGKQVDYVLEPETLVAQNVDPYAIFSVSTKYDYNENLSFKLGVNNIFDAQPESESNFKENGRTYFLSLTGSF